MPWEEDQGIRHFELWRRQSTRYRFHTLLSSCWCFFCFVLPLIWWSVAPQTSASLRMKVSTERMKSCPKEKKRMVSKRSATLLGMLRESTEWGLTLLLGQTQEISTAQSSLFLLQLPTSHTGKQRCSRSYYNHVVLMNANQYLFFSSFFFTPQVPWVWKVPVPLLQHRQQQQWIRTQQLWVQSSRHSHGPWSRLLKGPWGWPFQLWPPGLHRGAQHVCGPGQQARGHRSPHLQPLQHRAAPGPVGRPRSFPVSPSSSSDHWLHHASCASQLSPWQRGRVEPVPAVLLFVLVKESPPSTESYFTAAILTKSWSRHSQLWERMTIQGWGPQPCSQSEKNWEERIRKRSGSVCCPDWQDSNRPFNAECNSSLWFNCLKKEKKTIYFAFHLISQCK